MYIGSLSIVLYFRVWIEQSRTFCGTLVPLTPIASVTELHPKRVAACCP